MECIGKLSKLRRYPVKGMAGEDLDAAYVTYAGLLGDRVYAFVDAEGPANFPWMTARKGRDLILFRPRFLNALPDNRTAMLYSLNALTSYGHANLQLDNRWHLMGAMEALNGWLLFGLSTAFLFAMIERLSALDRK